MLFTILCVVNTKLKKKKKKQTSFKHFVIDRRKFRSE
jgi:hypothetical protein